VTARPVDRIALVGSAVVVIRTVDHRASIGLSAAAALRPAASVASAAALRPDSSVAAVASGALVAAVTAYASGTTVAEAWARRIPAPGRKERDQARRPDTDATDLKPFHLRG